MNLACYVMLRNESPILGPFLDQLETFFDYSVIVDHGSTDDSVDQVRARSTLRHALYHLTAAGYPQAPVATHFARDLLSSGDFDALFLLDCDEFLPFADRDALESFLGRQTGTDVIRLNWLNACPMSFDADNIFAHPFERAAAPSPIQKAILRSSLWRKAPDFEVLQGYHGISSAQAGAISVSDSEDAFLIHVPIQSRTQIAVKLANGHNRLIRERTNLARNQGYHWVEAARDLARGSFQDELLRSLALGYPHSSADSAPPSIPLGFDFPYVRSAYRESSRHLAAQIAGLIEDDSAADGSQATSYTVSSSDGTPVITSWSGKEQPSGGDSALASAHPRPMLLALDTLGQDYSSLIEPLFDLPTRLPDTAWEGHIPFMFVLFKLLAPKCYVELGVHHGASFIAACTAAKSYNIRCQLFAIDTWEGDDHAGHYEGERIYQELKGHIEGTYPSARLVRRLFAEARPSFAANSIDLLHIDGLHTYDAVREDFTTWFGAMAPAGVILFHDIFVHQHGFGVHRLWAELKEQFATMEFHHSHGLGVLFLDPSDQRLAPLLAIARDEKAMQLYQDLAAAIAGTLRERMGYLGAEDIVAWRDRELADRNRELADRDHELAELRSQLQAVWSSTSWRISRPIRAVRRLLG